jgi:Family of unknown function (DUF6518)
MLQLPRSARTRSVVVASGPSSAIGWVVAVGVGLAGGAFTAYGQEWLSDATSSLANSAGPWSLVAFLVARYNKRLPAAVVAAALALASCEVGYALATELRGGSNATSTVVFWFVAAVIAGPPLGVAGAWSTRGGMGRGVGFAVIGGVLIGEGLYGWTTVADTTDWRYWATELVAGVALVAVFAARSHWPRHTMSTLTAAAATASVVFAAGRLA